MNHKPRKRFGQHFLESFGVIQNIIQAVHPQTTDHLVEIGPGLGALTKPLLENHLHLTVIEIDRDLAKHLQKIPNLMVHNEDALKFDFNKLHSAKAQKLRIIGNLPYNISTPLLFHLLSFSPIIQDMHFMLQEEVVNRMIASPHTKDYGRLSIQLQYHCEVYKLFSIPPSAFSPPPKVQSAFVRIVPLTAPKVIAKNMALFQMVVNRAFQQRRKTVNNALKNVLTSPDFERLKIDKSLRPENLSVDDYVTISNYLADKGIII